MTHISLAQLGEIRRKNQGRRLGFIVGSFNIVHPGHLRLIKFARSLVDELAIALLPDSDTGSYVNQELRLAGIQALDMVDLAFIIDDNPKACIEALRPDIIFKGAEHETRSNPEAEWIKAWGGKLRFCTDDPRFSFDEMLRGMLNARADTPKITLPGEYMERHGFQSDSLRDLLGKLSVLRVSIIGDLIIDEYVLCNPLGMSREDPTLVVSPLEKTRFVGGAGIVAGHAAGLGGKTNFITVSGNDAVADYAEKWLQDQNIRTIMIRDPDRSTTSKRRYKAQNKTLLRVNRLSPQHIDQDRQQCILRHLDSILEETDLVILSDFSYGVLPPALATAITTRCREHGVPIAADSQSSSQVGDLSKFKNTLLVTPTELEARHAMRNFNEGLVALTESLMKEIHAANIITTLGEDGCLIYSDPDIHKPYTDRLPSLNRNALDVAGAGDSLLAASAMALAAGGNIWEAALLGSIAAAVQVGRMGNIPLKPEEILAAMGNA